MNTATISSISTQTVPPCERAAYWRDQICDTFVELDCDRIGDGFFGELEDYALGPVQLTRVRSSRHEAIRSARQIAKSVDEYFLVSLQISGQGLIEQDGRIALLQPGDFALYDSTRRYLLRFDDQFEELVLKLPRAMVTDRIAMPEYITATCISGRRGLGRLAFDFACGVAREIDHMPSAECGRVSNNLVDLLGSAFASGANVAYAGNANTSSQLLRAKLLIAEHLRDPDLNKLVVADQLGISVRYLSKLFALEGVSFSEWLREQRLVRIAKDLSEPGLAMRTISSVAYGWGMKSMPHFSRVFRQLYSCTPKQYRKDALGTSPEVSTSKNSCPSRQLC